MRALNPNHPVTREIEEQWYKLCAILMHKFGLTEVQITSDDIERFMNSGRANITIHPKGDILTLALISDAEATRLVHKEGGLPV